MSALTTWAQETGRRQPASMTPQPGDLILFATRHVGIVSAVNPDGTIATIEGNSENRSMTPAQVDPNTHDRFLLRQRIRPIVNQYEFSVLDGAGDGDGQAFCFVEQKRFKFKEDIRFYADETKTTEVLRIKARQAFDPKARYEVTLPSGDKVGEIQKVFGESLLRSTYRLYDAGGQEVAKATEKSLFVALFRRLVGFIPWIGDFADWLPIPYHFVFTRGEDVLGMHSRRSTFRDTYSIDFSDDPERTVDRRLVLAIAVGMDALQAR